MPSQENDDLELLAWLGNIVPSEVVHLQEQFESSPSRISDAYRELLEGYNGPSPRDILKVTEYIEPGSYTGLVSGLGIDFLALCSHHFLPFIGTVDVLYQPGDRVLGIGKLSRLVGYRTRRFTIQETIARELCEDLLSSGEALGAFARVTAHHLCLCYRGPRQYGSSNTVVFSSGSCATSSMQPLIASALGRP